MTSGNIMAGWLSAGTPTRRDGPASSTPHPAAAGPRSQPPGPDRFPTRAPWQEGERLSLSDLVQPDSAVDRPVGQTYANPVGAPGEPAPEDDDHSS